MIRKFHEAKASGAASVTCWGSGKPLREFLYADDLARACVFLMERYSEEQFINVGYGSDISIRDLAEVVRRIVGFEGEIEWDTTKPDGTPRKLMDSSRLFALGWKPRIDLETGIRLAYDDFLKALSLIGHFDPAFAMVAQALHVRVHHQLDEVGESGFRLPAQLALALE